MFYQGVGGLTSGIEQAVGSGARTFGGGKCHGYHCGKTGGSVGRSINGFFGNAVNAFADGKL